MNFSFHPEAEEEFNAAIDYYEEIERGFGYDFALEVYSTIQLSIEFPKAWSVLEGEVRRFPYGILYSEEQDRINVVAVMHLHRRPDYWKH